MKKLLSKINIHRNIRVALVSVLLFACIGFTGTQQDSRICSDILVRIDNQYNNYFVDENDVRELVGTQAGGFVIGRRLDNIDLKAAEGRLLTSAYIDEAQVYKDIRGNIVAHVELARPIARIMGANHTYISDRGGFLPYSRRYAPRVLLLSGKGAERLPGKGSLLEQDAALFDLLQFIYNDPFWQAQIAELVYTKEGEVILHQQVGKQYIEFGKPENIADKFDRLHIFYKEILPRKGWNYYEKVNLKYANQIVCE